MEKPTNEEILGRTAILGMAADCYLTFLDDLIVSLEKGNDKQRKLAMQLRSMSDETRTTVRFLLEQFSAK